MTVWCTSAEVIHIGTIRPRLWHICGMLGLYHKAMATQYNAEEFLEESH
jgi:hypothetical protein